MRSLSSRFASARSSSEAGISPARMAQSSATVRGPARARVPRMTISFLSRSERIAALVSGLVIKASKRAMIPGLS
jgi:hypothetical protein